jgi:hypothetical protein
MLVQAPALTNSENALRRGLHCRLLASAHAVALSLWQARLGLWFMDLDVASGG